MPWKRLPNSVQGFPWPTHDTHVERNCPPATARRIALKHPDEYNCFFFCSGETPLTKRYKLQVGGAVFFLIDDATVRSFEGTAFDSMEPSDLYMKTGMTVVYYNPNRDPGNPELKPLASVGDYVTNDGGAAIDVVCIFAANLRREGNLQGRKQLVDKKLLYHPTADEKKNGIRATVVCANDFVKNLLDDKETIEDLKDKGITVLLSVLNDWDKTGWSNFNSEAQGDPSAVAKQLKNVVQKYQLGGIDIDDEYADQNPEKFYNSLAMLTAKLRYEMPDFIVSKALFQDEQYFSHLLAIYPGKDGDKKFKLGELLTYGWEMTYWEQASASLPTYLEPGRMKSRKRLLKGFKIEKGRYTPPVQDAKWLKDNEYGGVMVFNFQFGDHHELMRQLVVQWLGPENWKHLKEAQRK